MTILSKPLLNETKTDLVDQEPLILAEDLCVSYLGEKEKKNDFISIVHDHLSLKKDRKYDLTWALNGVSFAGYPGDVLGVIGPNGAGKTTLCRAILGLVKPDRGRIKVRGEASSLLSLGTGFNLEISGRENIRLNGLMLGFSRKRLDQMMLSIEEFTGLGRFLDHPLKFYSSGMRARLGFSIVAALEPEIIVIDEVLGTGDLEFKERAVKRMQELVSGAKMVLVVTHDTDFVEENCTRALWLDKGRVAAIGEPKDIVHRYQVEVADNAKPTRMIMSPRETRAMAGQEETIQVKNLGIKFKLGKEPFWALKDISFSVREKEILGIIGPNGAGKTTLCRTLCGLYRPDRGYVQVKGEITALLSFALGFNNQLSGYDNIYLNGMMLGIPKDVIFKLVDEIVVFAELEKVIHKPVKEYSKGMRSRLAFSIAAMLQPDVFIVDEALSAGDLAFRDKATLRLQEMLEDAKTVILVTHSLGIVEKVCTRAIWLQQGAIQYDGDPKEAVSIYKASVAKYQRMKRLLPLHEDDRLKQAVEQFGTGEYAVAEALFREVLRERPDDFNLLMQFAEIAEAREKWVRAKKRWERVLKIAELSGKPVPEQVQVRLSEIEQKLLAKKAEG